MVNYQKILDTLTYCRARATKLTSHGGDWKSENFIYQAGRALDIQDGPEADFSES